MTVITKFLESNKIEKLEELMNDFLSKEQIKADQIVKIYYNKVLVDKEWYNNNTDLVTWFSYSCLIVYEKKG